MPHQESTRERPASPGSQPPGAHDASRQAAPEPSVARRRDGSAAGPPPSVLPQLGAALQAGGLRMVRWLPHPDRWRVVGAAGSLGLEVAHDHGGGPDGARVYTLSPEATGGLTAALYLSTRASDRLRAAEDAGRATLASVLSALAWGGPGEAPLALRADVDGQRVVGIWPDAYARVDVTRLLAALEHEEGTGETVVVGWRGARAALWLEVRFPTVGPFDLSAPDAPAGGRRDLWDAGALLVNVEDGTKAAVVVPALRRRQGGLVLPMVEGWRPGVRRRHRTASKDARPRPGRGGDPSTGEELQLQLRDAALAEALVAAIREARTADFTEMAARVARLHQVSIPPDAIAAYLEEPGRGLGAALRRRALERLARGRFTGFRVVTAVLALARELDEPSRRLQACVAAGRYTWSRGRPRRERPPSGVRATIAVREAGASARSDGSNRSGAGRPTSRGGDV